MTRTEAAERLESLGTIYGEGLIECLEALGLLHLQPEVDQSPINKTRKALRGLGYPYLADDLDVVLKSAGCKIVEDK